MPSVLVELGYLSNAKDEAQLRDPDWREQGRRPHLRGHRRLCRRPRPPPAADRPVTMSRTDVANRPQCVV